MSGGRATAVVKNDDQTGLVLQAAQRRARRVFKIRRGEAGATELLQLG
jgi:hypothetical protein